MQKKNVITTNVSIHIHINKTEKRLSKVQVAKEMTDMEPNVEKCDRCTKKVNDCTLNVLLAYFPVHQKYIKHLANG